jgi:hypothetical protein
MPSKETGMPYKVLSKKDAKIIAAMAGGIIPRGGASFELGAADIEDKWLPRTDIILSRTPFVTRFTLRVMVHILNYAWPVIFMGKFKQLVNMDEQERTELLHLIENSAFPGPFSLLIVKVLVFPAFYGIIEVKDAIGYKEKFDNSQGFKGVRG